jgi:molybdate transport system substrate-binding protein
MLVSAGASLRDVLTATAKTFEAAHPGLKLEFSFEASSTLSRQIHEGAPVDVFLSADAANVDRIRDDLDAATIAPFLSNHLALVVREGLESPPASPRDLPGRAGMLALAGPEVPAGEYARAWLEKAGLMKPLAAQIVNADNVRAALALVEAGAADWAIVYKTDALVAKRSALAWVASDAEDVGIAYVMAVVARTRAPEARAYLEFLASEAFQAEAEKMGFRRPR